MLHARDRPVGGRRVRRGDVETEEATPQSGGKFRGHVGFTVGGAEPVRARDLLVSLCRVAPLDADHVWPALLDVQQRAQVEYLDFPKPANNLAAASRLEQLLQCLDLSAVPALFQQYVDPCTRSRNLAASCLRDCLLFSFTS